MAQRWIQEWELGIASTGLNSGFIKISVDAGKLTQANQKQVKAAELTRVQTGLIIASHTGNGEAIMGELKILRESSVSNKALFGCMP